MDMIEIKQGLNGGLMKLYRVSMNAMKANKQ
jgi:hypothetical protein